MSLALSRLMKTAESTAESSAAENSAAGERTGEGERGTVIDALETLELFYCDETRALSRKVRQKHQAVAAYFTRALKMKVAC